MRHPVRRPTVCGEAAVPEPGAEQPLEQEPERHAAGQMSDKLVRRPMPVIAGSRCPLV